MSNRQLQPCVENWYIKGIPYDQFLIIKNISARTSAPMTKLLRDMLRDIKNDYSNKIKETPCQTGGCISLTAIRQEMKSDYQGMANYYGVDVNSLMKIKIIDKLQSIPEALKREFIK